MKHDLNFSAVKSDLRKYFKSSAKLRNSSTIILISENIAI